MVRGEGVRRGCRGCGKRGASAIDPDYQSNHRRTFPPRPSDPHPPSHETNPPSKSATQTTVITRGVGQGHYLTACIAYIYTDYLWYRCSRASLYGYIYELGNTPVAPATFGLRLMFTFLSHTHRRHTHTQLTNLESI